MGKPEVTSAGFITGKILWAEIALEGSEPGGVGRQDVVNDITAIDRTSEMTTVLMKAEVAPMTSP